jgi:hypothetical protein
MTPASPPLERWSAIDERLTRETFIPRLYRRCGATYEANSQKQVSAALMLGLLIQDFSKHTTSSRVIKGSANLARYSLAARQRLRSSITRSSYLTPFAPPLRERAACRPDTFLTPFSMREPVVYCIASAFFLFSSFVTVSAESYLLPNLPFPPRRLRPGNCAQNNRSGNVLRTFLALEKRNEKRPIQSQNDLPAVAPHPAGRLVYPLGRHGSGSPQHPPDRGR